MTGDFRFAEPHFLHALWGVLAFVGLLFWLEARGGSALEGLVGSALQHRLVQRPGAWRRRLRIALVGLAAAAAVLALMRPQWGMRVVAASRSGAEIMIALDVSRSMMAEDVAPNRLERAKAEIVDLLAYLDGDQVGLIAFAGRASVVSPLTPDFGFLRLVLDETGPGSVTRGGTRLAEPIQKAVAGFGPSEGAARAILLFTDGEDHDSFVLDAAKEAAAAGIKIIAIGFGDESGSEISITDPRTGARTLVRDADGRPVRSRLDGDTLRELALATDGAYVPAGTGVLDLESIYDEHISRLTRGELDGSRTVRDEGYPWFVLLALVLLVSSAAVSGGRLRGAAMAGLLLAVMAPAQPAMAQPDRPPPLVLDGDPGGASMPPGAAAGEAPVPAPEEPPEEAPRDVYNRGVAALAERDYDAAERLLARARRDAKGDDELRFQASYNLGWVGVQQSGRVQGQSPQEALDLLYRAADWFREAVRLRPEDDEARHNLEVTLKRALVLADEIAKASQGGVEGALAELVERQRGVAAGVAGLLEAAEAALAAMDSGEALRGAFRAQATGQRAVLSDAEQLAVTIADERDAIQARPEEERTPEDAMRGAQLEGVLVYLHRARERMGQARRQLRQRQGPRAYRRASAALLELKRASDVLRDPVAVLDQLMADGTDLVRGTVLLLLAERGMPGAGGGSPPVPPWLDVEGVGEGQAALAERIAELHARFAAGLESAAAADPATIPPEQAVLIESVREAAPLVEEGRVHAQAAADALADDSLGEAPESQQASLLALADARERFLDVRGLIEAMYADEKRIAEVADSEDPALDRDEFAPTLRTAQGRNLARSARLAAQFDTEGEQLTALAEAIESGSLDPDTPAPDPETVQDQIQHLEIAKQVLALANGSMEAVGRGLGEPAAGDEGGSVDWDWVRSDVAQAVEHLESLRLLFFSITEHIRDVARRQLDLADQTRDAMALAAAPDVDPTAEAAPLVQPQRALAAQTLTIADALESQSQEAAAGAAEDPQSGESAERLRKAAEHVLLAQTEMEAAVSSLDAPADLEPALVAERTAVEELKAALEILEPPQEQPPEENQGDQQEQQQQQQQESGAEDPAEQGGEDPQAQPEEEEALGADPGQILQEVRDREAQRRRERARKPSRYETVEKDW